MDRILYFLSAVFAFDWLFRKFFIERPIKIVLKQRDFLLSFSKPVLKEICCLGIRHKWNLNPSTPKISLVILVTNCHKVLMM